MEHLNRAVVSKKRCFPLHYSVVIRTPDDNRVGIKTIGGVVSNFNSAGLLIPLLELWQYLNMEM
jgi:hypothetical protein